MSTTAVTAQQLRDDLDAVIRLLELGWTQGASGRDIENYPVAADSRFARRWSLIGAIWRVGRSGTRESAMSSALRAALVARGESRYLMGWDDAPGRTQAEVIALVREAREAVTGTPSAARESVLMATSPAAFTDIFTEALAYALQPGSENAADDAARVPGDMSDLGVPSQLAADAALACGLLGSPAVAFMAALRTGVLWERERHRRSAEVTR